MSYIRNEFDKKNFFPYGDGILLFSIKVNWSLTFFFFCPNIISLFHYVACCHKIFYLCSDVRTFPPRPSSSLGYPLRCHPSRDPFCCPQYRLFYWGFISFVFHYNVCLLLFIWHNYPLNEQGDFVFPVL